MDGVGAGDGQVLLVGHEDRVHAGQGRVAVGRARGEVSAAAPVRLGRIGRRVGADDGEGGAAVGIRPGAGGAGRPVAHGR